MNLNCWLGCGRLTKDAELLTTKKGTTMSKFRLAVNDRRNDDTLFVKWQKAYSQDYLKADLCQFKVK